MNFTKTHSTTAADSLKDIAKAVRADIKAAKKAGLLDSDLKVSVRTDYYSMGQALRVKITGCSFPVMNEARVRFEHSNPSDWHIIPSPEGCEERYTAHAQAQADVVTEIVKSYNWDKSDMMTDYYHVNFSFTHCDYDHKITSAEKAEIRARIATEAQEKEVVEVEEIVLICDEPNDYDCYIGRPETFDALAEAEAEVEAATKALAEAKKKRLEIARLQAQARELLTEAARLLAEADALAA